MKNDECNINIDEVLLRVVRKKSEADFTMDSKLLEIGITDDLDFIDLLLCIELEFEVYGLEFPGDSDPFLSSCLNVINHIGAVKPDITVRHLADYVEQYGDSK